MLGVHEEGVPCPQLQRSSSEPPPLGPWAESKGPRISVTFCLPLSSDPESVPVLILQDNHSSVLITTG